MLGITKNNPKTNFDSFRFMIIVGCEFSIRRNKTPKIGRFSFLFRTPSPPPVLSVADDPLRVRLFPDESDEDLNRNSAYR